MSEPISYLRESFPELKYTFSFTSEFDDWESQNVSFLDLLELHLWMTHFSDFYEKVGYSFERWSNEGYRNLAEKGKDQYLRKREYYQEALKDGLDFAIEWSKVSGKILATTEGWGVVDYKDYPLLEWDWIKELCEIGTKKAVDSGRWQYICTSNFSGPQFRGIWRDTEWHQRMTEYIHSGSLDSGFTD